MDIIILFVTANLDSESTDRLKYFKIEIVSCFSVSTDGTQTFGLTDGYFNADSCIFKLTKVVGMRMQIGGNLIHQIVEIFDCLRKYETTRSFYSKEMHEENTSKKCY